MKYTLDLLPINAFQGRGTPVGGRGLRLHGGSDSGYVNPHEVEAAQEAAYQATALANAGEPAAPAAPAADSGGGGGGGGEPAPAYSEPAYTAPAAPAPAAPVPPLTAANPNAGWELQPEEFFEGGGSAPPYYRNVITGERKEVGQPVQYGGVNPVDPNTLAQHLAPNFQGTPTQFYDEQGNLKGVLVDSVRAGLGTREGELILDPMSLGLALKQGETASIDSKIQQRNEQGQLLFVDPLTGNTTIYNTGVPAETGSTVKDLLYMNERKYGGQIPADTAQGMLMLALTMATGGVGGALLNVAGFGAGAAGGVLTATEAAALMGGTLSEAGAVATMGTQGINWGAIATSAAKQGVLSAGVTALKGGSPSDILKAGLIGTATSGAGGAIGSAGLGDIGTMIAKGALQVGTTAATGGNVTNALISSVIGAVLPTAMEQIIPKDTFEGLPTAIKSTLEKAVASSITAAATGGNLTDAALNSIMSSATNAVTDYVSEATGFKGLTLAQSLDKIGNYFKPVDTGSGDSTTTEVDGAGGALATTTVPPLIQQATGKSDPNEILDALKNAYAEAPTTIPPLQMVATAPPTNDAGALPVSGGTTAGGFLGEYKDLAPAKVYGSAVPQVDADGKVITYEQPKQDTTGGLKDYLANAPREIRDQAMGVFEVAMNQLGFAVGNVAAAGYGAGQTWYNLATGEPVDPRAINEVANEIAKRLSYIPQTTAGQNLNEAVSSIPESLTGSTIGLPPVTNLSALPSVGPIPMPNVGLLSGDLTNAIANAQRGITMDGAKSFSTSVGEVIGNLLPKIDSTAAVTNETGALTGSSTIPKIGYNPSESGALTTGGLSVVPRLGYTVADNTAVRAPLTAERMASLERMFQEADDAVTYPTSTEPTPATQTSTNTQTGALPTTVADRPQINYIDLGGDFDQGTLTTLNNQAKVIDDSRQYAVSNPEIIPQLQAETKAFTQSVFDSLKFSEAIPPETINFYDRLFFGMPSQGVIDSINNAAKNSAAPITKITQQTSGIVKDLPPEQQAPVAAKILENTNKLGKTPDEAIVNKLIDRTGQLTKLGEEIVVKNQPEPEPQPQPEPDPDLPIIKPKPPVKDVDPPLSVNPPTNNVNPPPPSVNPPLSNVNPPLTNVNPPTNDVNPPIVDPTKSVTSPLTPTASTPAAPTATGSGGYGYGGYSLLAPTVGALPGNLESTSLKGADVKDYNPFENYNVYQQLAPLNAASGGGTGALQQMQQGIAGVDPRLYGMLQARATPNYFSYGSDQNSGLATSFAGNQIMAKPTPSIPLISTSGDKGTQALYKMSGAEGSGGSGTPATLGATALKDGGTPHIPEFVTGATGHYVKGRGDGQSDDIPAMLADGEFVWDAATVADLGNGSSDAGARLLDEFRKVVREHKRSASTDKIPPKASPLEYMRVAINRTGRLK